MQQSSAPKQPNGFAQLGLSAPLLRAVSHSRVGWRKPTPIQRAAIPVAIQGRDIAAMARTGSGKSGAFLLPMVERLQCEHSKVVGVRAMVVAPTRDLACQLATSLDALIRFTDLRYCLIVGGDSLEQQFEALRLNPDVVIATPGRLLHVLRMTSHSLHTLQCLILDEADRLLEQGFQQDLEDLFQRAPSWPQRQTMMFSATMPSNLARLAKAGLHDPAVLRVEPQHKVSPLLKNYMVALPSSGHKLAALAMLLRIQLQNQQQQGEVQGGPRLTLVFVATRHHVEFVHNVLKQSAGIDSAYVYGSMEPTARKIQLGKFRAGVVPVLIVTDVAARGIDLPMLDCVINMHFPDKPKLFVHRVGRVARAGRSGTAFSILDRTELPYALDTANFLQLAVEPITPGEDFEESAEDASEQKKQEVVRLGGCPPQQLELESEHITRTIQADADLTAMEKVCSRGFKMYQSSRAGASSSAVSNSKSSLWDTVFGVCSSVMVHPHVFPRSSFAPQQVIADVSETVVSTENEVKRTELLESLRHFKTKSTVFEISGQDDVMKRKRVAHSGSIRDPRGKNLEISQRVAQAWSNDPEFEALQASLNQSADNDGDEQQWKGHHRRSLDNMVLDVTGDDQETIRQLQKMKRWDAKRKKYISVKQLMDDQTVKSTAKKRRINESGQFVSSKETQQGANLFEKWKKKHRAALPVVGSFEEQMDGAPQGKMRRVGPQSLRGGRRGGAQPSRNAAAPRDELKRPEQMLKQRKEKARLQAQHQRNSQKKRGKARGRK